jgi:hypothetical protein
VPKYGSVINSRDTKFHVRRTNRVLRKLLSEKGHTVKKAQQISSCKEGATDVNIYGLEYPLLLALWSAASVMFDIIKGVSAGCSNSVL